MKKKLGLKLQLKSCFVWASRAEWKLKDVGDFPPQLSVFAAFVVGIARSQNWVADWPVLSEIIKPLYNYLLCYTDRKYKTFTNVSSITDCLEVLESFAGTALQSGCNPWSFDFFPTRIFCQKERLASFREFCGTAAASFELSSAPDAMCNQSTVPVQHLRTEMDKGQTVRLSGEIIGNNEEYPES